MIQISNFYSQFSWKAVLYDSNFETISFLLMSSSTHRYLIWKNLISLSHKKIIYLNYICRKLVKFIWLFLNIEFNNKVYDRLLWAAWVWETENISLGLIPENFSKNCINIYTVFCTFWLQNVLLELINKIIRAIKLNNFNINKF